MTIRAVNEPYGHPDQLVRKMISSKAYEIIKFVAENMEYLLEILKVSPYYPTIEEAIEKVDVGFTFTSDDQGEVTDHPNELRTYRRIAAPSFAVDLGDSAAPISQAKLDLKLDTDIFNAALVTLNELITTKADNAEMLTALAEKANAAEVDAAVETLDEAKLDKAALLGSTGAQQVGMYSGFTVEQEIKGITMAQLKALPAQPDKARFTVSDARVGGTFIFRTGDYSAMVTADPDGIIFIPPSGETGTNGVFVRNYNSGFINVLWAGLDPALGSDCSPKLRKLVALCAALKPTNGVSGPRLYFPTGDYLFNSGVLLGNVSLYGDGMVRTALFAGAGINTLFTQTQNANINDLRFIVVDRATPSSWPNRYVDKSEGTGFDWGDGFDGCYFDRALEECIRMSSPVNGNIGRVRFNNATHFITINGGGGGSINRHVLIREFTADISQNTGTNTAVKSFFNIKMRNSDAFDLIVKYGRIEGGGATFAQNAAIVEVSDSSGGTANNRGLRVFFGGGGINITNSETKSGTGATATFTLTYEPVGGHAPTVTVDSVDMTAGVDYTITGKQITFTSIPAAGTNNIVIAYSPNITFIKNSSTTANMVIPFEFMEGYQINGLSAFVGGAAVNASWIYPGIPSDFFQRLSSGMPGSGLSNDLFYGLPQEVICGKEGQKITFGAGTMLVSGMAMNVDDGVLGSLTGETTIKSIASDAIDVTGQVGWVRIDTEGSASTDNLSTITGGRGNMEIILHTNVTARAVTVKHNVGNIFLGNTGADVVLNSNKKTLCLRWSPLNNQWLQV